jgi:hypothetical protein
MSRWREIERGDIPKGPGVYVVYQNDVIVYVGSTTSLWHRCRVYWKQPQWRPDYDDPRPRPVMWATPWGRVSTGAIRVKVKRSYRLGDWLMWEWRLISRLAPKHNRAGKLTANG